MNTHLKKMLCSGLAINLSAKAFILLILDNFIGDRRKSRLPLVLSSSPILFKSEDRLSLALLQVFPMWPSN